MPMAVNGEAGAVQADIWSELGAVHASKPTPVMTPVAAVGSSPATSGAGRSGAGSMTGLGSCAAERTARTAERSSAPYDAVIETPGALTSISADAGRSTAIVGAKAPRGEETGRIRIAPVRRPTPRAGQSCRGPGVPR